mmetsp:Transcript_46449/g.107985  ORF Transcript_46449/g.107985 Transcript_46449/m.107985 type:complete len:106 (-) Transcript_46449:222-539(-)
MFWTSGKGDSHHGLARRHNARTPWRPFQALPTAIHAHDHHDRPRRNEGGTSSMYADDKFISRKHAQLERRGSNFHVTDLSSSRTWVNFHVTGLSSSRTWINGQRI